jgi:tetratricopeptide (TPR) repeat protein
VFYFDWDFSRAERYFLKAIDLNPNSSESHYQYATYLQFADRGNESVTEMRRAVELDPLSHRRNSNLGWALIHARRYDEAIEHLRSALELFTILPDSTEERWTRYLLAGSFRRAGRFEEALAEIDAWNLGRGERALVYIQQGRSSEALALWEDPGDDAPYWFLAAAGERERALEIAEELKARVAAGAQNLSMNIAAIYAILDEKDLAFEWLQRAYEARVQGLIFLSWANWQWDNLRDDQRFEALLADIRSGK